MDSYARKDSKNKAGNVTEERNKLISGELINTIGSLKKLGSALAVISSKYLAFFHLKM